MKIYLLVGFILLSVSLNWAATRFVDRNRDGINDWFTDRNGDGINDVDQKPYPHDFDFVDKDQDGINDLFVDQDGDGVNDLDNPLCLVIDVDHDHVNDITGLPYRNNSPNGYRFGFVIEEKRTRIENFLDQDGDGMHDRVQEQFFRDMDGDGFNDHFIDRNGDGINDRFQMKNQNRFLLRPGARRPLGPPPGRP